MGAGEVGGFLTHLARDGHVSASTQNQALSALLFLYREVLELDVPWLDGLVRAKRPAAKVRPLPLLQHADIDVAYTERAIADSPKCSIREHVDATRAEINHLLRMYGSKPVNAK